jgi:hypothetical protein
MQLCRPDSRHERLTSAADHANDLFMTLFSGVDSYLECFVSGHAQPVRCPVQAESGIEAIVIRDKRSLSCQLTLVTGSEIWGSVISRAIGCGGEGERRMEGKLCVIATATLCHEMVHVVMCLEEFTLASTVNFSSLVSDRFYYPREIHSGLRCGQGRGHFGHFSHDCGVTGLVCTASCVATGREAMAHATAKPCRLSKVSKVSKG